MAKTKKKAGSAPARRRRQAGAAPVASAQSITIADKIMRGIERDILNGRRKPGDHLNEQEIADQFKVSRTPVREAMRQLASAGLIEVQRRRGAFVTRVPMARLLQMFEVMTEIEALCARLAARRMKPEQREALKAMHKRYERLTKRPQDAEAYFEESSEFHRAIFAGTQNAVLEEIANQIYGRLLGYRRRQLGISRRPEVSFQEHSAVLRALIAGDAEKAEAGMRAHSGMVSGNVFDVVTALSGED